MVISIASLHSLKSDHVTSEAIIFVLYCARSEVRVATH